VERTKVLSSKGEKHSRGWVDCAIWRRGRGISNVVCGIRSAEED